MKIYEIVTDRIMELMEAGTIPWKNPWRSSSGAKNLISKKPYRGINQFLLNCSAAAIVLIHNHPSGDPSPSKGDIEITNRLKECCQGRGLFPIMRYILNPRNTSWRSIQ